MTDHRILSILVSILVLTAAPAWGQDTDGDNTDDVVDLCVQIADPQTDTDGDLYGNLCDCDFDGDGFCGISDFNAFLPDFIAGTDSGLGTDMDSDGGVGIGDFNAFLPGFQAGVPGPSGQVPDGDGDGVSVAGGDCDDGDPNQAPGLEVVAGSAGAYTEGACFPGRGPFRDMRDTDGCSASLLVDVLNRLSFLPPPDPAAVKNNPLDYLTSGACSAPFGFDDAFVTPGACELHDACLSTCGATQLPCDLEFGARLLETCAAHYPVGGTCRNACDLLATTYAVAIAAIGEQAYLNDQRVFCTCCPDRSACGDGSCDYALGEGAANCATDCQGAFSLGQECISGLDCATGHCSFQGVCAPAFCVVSTDCGPGGICNLGVCLDRPLENGSNCAVNAACSSGVCNFGVCIAGSLPAVSPCTTSAACRSGSCTAGFCDSVCPDGFCDGLEKCGDANAGFECTADCGLCSNGAICINSSDCQSGVCNAGFCIAGNLPNGSICTINAACASDVCNFGFCINGNLAAGSPCTTSAACRSGLCQGGLCEDICGDGFCDGLEKCGDANAGLECNADCGKCANGQICLSNADCQSNRCLAGICAAQTFCGDLSCNGNETCSSCVIDCGPCCTPNGSVCVLDAQCCSGDCRGFAPPRCG